jgi:hypothetical protein
MVRKSLSAAIAAAMILIVGCANFQKGQEVVKWERGGALRVGTAPTDGQYALFSGTDLRNPQITYALRAGDRIGFVAKNGDVFAVAGSHEDPVVTGEVTKSYFWRRVGPYPR